MGDFTAVADVSTILEQRLNQALATLATPGRAFLWDPNETPQNSGASVGIFLYEIAEDPASRNRPFTRAEPAVRGEPARHRKPPMALLLRYLITAWGGSPVAQHQMLGRVLQTLYDDSIFDSVELTGSLAGSTDTMALTLTPLTLDQKSYVWFALQKPFRLSLNYEVRVVNLESTVDQVVQPVTSRSLVTGAIDPARVHSAERLVRPR